MTKRIQPNQKGFFTKKICAGPGHGKKSKCTVDGGKPRNVKANVAARYPDAARCYTCHQLFTGRGQHKVVK
jgi:hypothetical protein